MEEEVTARQKNYAKLMKEQDGSILKAQRKLKFPKVPKGVEYMDIIGKGKRKLITYHSEIEGLSWRQLNEKLNKDGIETGLYNYALKFEKTPFVHTGMIKSVSLTPDKPKSDSELNEIKQNLKDIQTGLKNKVSGDGIGIDFILASVNQTHNTEISLYKYQIDQKDKVIKDLETEIKILNNELDEAEVTLTKIQSEGSNNKYLDVILGMLNKGKGAINKLGESITDIPNDIVQMLASVDYNRIPPDELTKLKIGLQSIVNSLPLKGR